jgi:large subunit ribosomal protein L6
MSRIGNNPVSIPSGVTISVDKSNVVTVKGPKGELTQAVHPDLEVSIEDGTLTVKRPSDQKRHKAAHGLYRSLVANMVTGVSEGYQKKMQVVGVGYRAEAKGKNRLEMSLGFSHPVIMILPPEVEVETENARGKDPIITLRSHDKQLIGQIAAKIRGFRPPEPYKGKGIRFVGENIRRKAGKTASK